MATIELTPGVDVRRAADRSKSDFGWLDSKHSFSFGHHYDPANVGFGALVAHNDETLPPGTGYPDHPHRDVEIVTMVLSGALRHTDSGSHTDVLVPGQVSRTSAGAGIVHAEVAAAEAGAGVTTRFVQTWLRPEESGGASSYSVAEVGRPADLTEIVGPGGLLSVGARGARLFLAHAGAGTLALPDAPRLHVFVPEGVVDLGDRRLEPGDAARLTDEGGRDLTVEEPALLLVWALAR
jgi:redox-sensitive bicupin YhaK (pirin superfamily)